MITGRLSIAFMFVSLSLFSGFFSLGAVVFLYLQHRTRILRTVTLFLTSLVLISSGFWIQDISASGEMELAAAIISLTGMVLNVGVLPWLVSILISRPIGGKLKVFLFAWDTILLCSGLLYPILSGPGIIFFIINVQLIVTISVCLVMLMAGLGGIQNPWMRHSLKAFIVISMVFLVFLIPDILISRLSITTLAFLDNLSLPFYLFSLNIGSFFFAGKFLNAGPLLEGGRVTDACKKNYALTEREIEIIEEMLDGKSNQELADRLFISKKTVENHLYNVYRKMEVKNRVQLIQTLLCWERESWG